MALYENTDDDLGFALLPVLFAVLPVKERQAFGAEPLQRYRAIRQLKSRLLTVAIVLSMIGALWFLLDLAYDA